MENLLTIENLAFQATAYEKYGCIDFDSFKVGILNEVIDELDYDKLISLFNNYVDENELYDERWYENEEYFYEIFFENRPMEAVRAAFYAKNYNYMDAYVRINDYGNLESCSTYELVDEIIKNKDFLMSLFESYNDSDSVGELIDFVNSNEEEITKQALELVRKGY